MSFNHLISAGQLLALQHSQQSVLILDCRFNLAHKQQGFEDFLNQHIAGAQYADLEQHLSGKIIAKVTGRHPLPTQNDWQHQLQSWALRQNQQVVVYDDTGGMMAARAWWMLRWAGHTKVALLDGGIQSWLKLAGRCTTGAANDLPQSDFQCHFQHQYIAQPDGQTALFDARNPERFSGAVEPIDRIAGHIPGAQCLPFTNNLNAQGLFKSPAQLKQQFENFLEPQQPCICYCGSGVTACHNILALSLAGYTQAKLYPGSWSLWINDSSNTIATST